MVPIYALVQEPETKGGNVVAKEARTPLRCPGLGRLLMCILQR